MAAAPQKNLENGLRQEDIDTVLPNVGLVNGGVNVWRAVDLRQSFLLQPNLRKLRIHVVEGGQYLLRSRAGLG